MTVMLDLRYRVSQPESGERTLHGQNGANERVFPTVVEKSKLPQLMIEFFVEVFRSQSNENGLHKSLHCAHPRAARADAAPLDWLREI
jgi:hypothetical protein